MSSGERPRVLFAGGGTGGHLYPALALARAFVARAGGAEVHFIGARRGVEARVLPEQGLPHTLLPFEPIRRTRVWQNWRLVPSLARAVRGIGSTVRSFRPHLVVGTGGYASGPVVAWAVLRGIPTAIQEQNSYPGLTTRLLAPRVRQIHLAFPEALSYLRPGRGTEVFTEGNPIERPDRTITGTAARERFGLGDGRVLLVVGGSQGARAINEAVLRDLAEVRPGDLEAAQLWVLWATGPTHFEPVAAEVARLGLGDRVRVEPYIQEMRFALAAADLAVSRSGAMALAELCAWGIPSILVPFPYAAADHQRYNAAALADAGAAVMIAESDLAPGRLWGEAVRLLGDDAGRAEMARRAMDRGRPDAAAKIADRLAMLLPAAIRGTPPRSDGGAS